MVTSVDFTSNVRLIDLSEVLRVSTSAKAYNFVVVIDGFIAA